MSLRSLAIATGLLVALAVPTAASASYTTGSVNLRTGPGTGYRVITSAPPGAYVRVLSCPSSWCRVSYRGITGWMSAGYISGTRTYRAPVYRPPVVVYPRPYYAPRPYYYPRYYRYPRTYYRPHYWRGNPNYSLRYRGPGWGFSVYGH